MKKIAFFFALLLGVLLAPLNTGAQISLVYPTGGESIPQNTSPTFRWSNSVALQVSAYLDHFSEAGLRLETITLVNYGYFGSGLDYVQYNTELLGELPLGLYRLRVEGVTQDGQRFGVQNRYTFSVTEAATLTCEALSTVDWLPATTKQFRLTWTNFSVGDPYAVYLFLSDRYIGEGYGFIMKTGIVETASGGIVFDAQFPTMEMSLYPPAPSEPIDANYHAYAVNTRNYIRAKSESFRVILSEVHIQEFGLKDFTTPIGKTVDGMAFTIDAKYAHTDVRSITLPFFVACDYTNSAAFTCGLFDGNKPVSRSVIVRTVPEEKYNFANFSLTTRGLKIPVGGHKTLTLHITPIRGLGPVRFGIDGQPDQFTAAGKHGEQITVAPELFWGPYIDVITAKKPKK